MISGGVGDSAGLGRASSLCVLGVGGWCPAGVGWVGESIFREGAGEWSLVFVFS